MGRDRWGTVSDREGGSACRISRCSSWARSCGRWSSPGSRPRRSSRSCSRVIRGCSTSERWPVGGRCDWCWWPGRWGCRRARRAARRTGWIISSSTPTGCRPWWRSSGPPTPGSAVRSSGRCWTMRRTPPVTGPPHCYGVPSRTPAPWTADRWRRRTENSSVTSRRRSSGRRSRSGWPPGRCGCCSSPIGFRWSCGRSWNS